MKKLFFIFYFLYFLHFSQEVVINQDLRTISTVRMVNGEVAKRTTEYLAIQLSLQKITQYHEEYYRALYRNELGKPPLRTRIKKTDDKLKMLAKYAVLISLTVFLSTQVSSANSDGFYYFLTRERLTWLLNILMPQLMSRVILFRSYQSNTLNTLDLSYLIAAQHDILRSTKFLNIPIDKTLYMIIFIALLKIIVGVQTDPTVDTIYNLGQTQAPAAGIYMENLIPNQFNDDQEDTD